MGSLLLVNVAYAQSPGFKSLLMPGPVVEGHHELEAECSNCHTSFDKKAQDRLCIECHEEVSNDIEALEGFHGRVNEVHNCMQCHTDHLGRDADIIRINEESFDHLKTDFALHGGHQKVICTACHQLPDKYRQAPGVCYDCHQEEDRHQEQLGKSCDDCHSPDTWTRTSFDHGKTQFPLEGKHKEVVCAACHPDERYLNITRTCHSCHALYDVHAGAYGETCDNCHVAEQWDEINFDHDRDTDFILLEGHKKAACQACHAQGQLAKSPRTTCVDCHLGDDQHQGKNGQKCANCHQQSNWSELIFKHDRDTEYLLRGKHIDADCAACHKGPVYEEKLEAACYACHKLVDVHEGRQGEQCDRCHQQQAWGDDVIFEHDLTAFPLIGMHSVVACEVCHIGGSFKEAESGCEACHKVHDEHNGAFGDACFQCHNPNGWNLWQFDHKLQTKFALEGAHLDLACASCHINPPDKSSAGSSSCVICHRGDDVHNNNFGTDCERCHTVERFDDLQKLNRR